MNDNRTHLQPHELDGGAASAQAERELTRSAILNAQMPPEGYGKAEAQSHAEYVEEERARRAEEAQKEGEWQKRDRARTTPTSFDAYFAPERLEYLEIFPGEATESEQYRIMRAARRDGVLEQSAEDTGDLPKPELADKHAAYRSGIAKIKALNAEMDGAAEAKKLTGCGADRCWCHREVEKADETLEVLDGEVIDGSKPWIIGQDIPTEVVEEFDGQSYAKGYQDGVVDGLSDEIQAKQIDDERGYAVDTEPAPVDQGNPSAHDLVTIDMAERKQHGLDVYGVTLQGGNGRDQLRDAYMEALDLVCYLRAALFERDGR